MAFTIVGQWNPPRRLAVCESLAEAERYVATLPGVEEGRYYIDDDCTGTVDLAEPGPKTSFTFGDVEIDEAEDALVINLPTMKALRLVEHLVQKIQRVI